MILLNLILVPLVTLHLVTCKWFKLHSIVVIEGTQLHFPNCFRESSYMTTCWMHNSETPNQYTTRSFNKYSKNNHKYAENKIYPHTSNIEEKKYIELQISILPYYGLIDSQICTVKK